jgi:CxxC motif-containing protein
MPEKEVRLIRCICCPKGCEIEVKILETGELLADTDCKTGKEYALQEIVDPRRVVTTTLISSSGKLVPVRTADSISKKLMSNVMSLTKELRVELPVKIGQRIALNMEKGNELNFMATRNVE